MRYSTLQSFTANSQNSAAFRLLTGEDLYLIWSGTGVMTHALYFQAENLTGQPWVPVYFPDLPSALVNASATAGEFILRNMPSGNYRVSTTAWTSGTRETMLMAQ